ncbi:MAG: MerR family transcriptional regulator [Muribaculaceae bacterium]|nr:MerR family transcriptional regulator [Muribaculaceae bacterium]
MASDSLDKKFYRIGDVSEMLDLPQPTLRYWEKEFSELRPRRNAGGTRLYTPNDIETLRVIKFLVRDKGLTIEGAREHMRRNRRTIDRTQRTIRRLQNIRKELQAIADALDGRGRK